MPVPYTDTLGTIASYGDYYSDEIIDQVYKSRTRYMPVDKDEFKNLVQRISNEDGFDYLKYIDQKWDEFVTDYISTRYGK